MPVQTTSPVTTFAGEVVGTSKLTRTQSGIAFTLSTSDLEAGHAVTIWWMIFNPDGSVSVQYAAGHVVGASGTANFAGFLQVGDTTGVINGGPGLLDPLEANVVLVVRDHGELDPSQVNQQILTFDGCCVKPSGWRAYEGSLWGSTQYWPHRDPLPIHSAAERDLDPGTEMITRFGCPGRQAPVFGQLGGASCAPVPV